MVVQTAIALCRRNLCVQSNALHSQALAGVWLGFRLCPLSTASSANVSPLHPIAEIRHDVLRVALVPEADFFWVAGGVTFTYIAGPCDYYSPKMRSFPARHPKSCFQPVSDALESTRYAPRSTYRLLV